MTTEKAVKLLHRIADEQFDGEYGDERREALEMAVRALEGDGDTIYRKQAIDAVNIAYTSTEVINNRPVNDYERELYFRIRGELSKLPSAQPQACDDIISRDDAIMAVKTGALSAATIFGRTDEGATAYYETVKAIKALPSAQPEKEKAKRVLWTGWKGCRDTRYKCPNCQKPVRNNDVYCHRCGQKLMFPHISFTDYIPGEEQELIVRWDDE